MSGKAKPRSIKALRESLYEIHTQTEALNDYMSRLFNMVHQQYHPNDTLPMQLQNLNSTKWTNNVAKLITDIECSLKEYERLLTNSVNLQKKATLLLYGKRKAKPKSK